MSERFAKLQARLVDAWGKAEASASAGQIEIGKLAHQAVRVRLQDAPRKSTRGFRAEAVQTLATALGRAGHRVKPCHLNRSIAISQVAALLGSTEAKKVPVRSLIALTKLVKRNIKAEEWNLLPKHAEATRALWKNIIEGKANPTIVQAEVNNILGVVPRVPRAKPSPAARFAKTLADTPDLQIAIAELKDTDADTFRRLLLAVKAIATTKKREPPATVGEPIVDEEKRCKLFGRAA